MLEGKRGLIIGVANEKSIAFGCAKKMNELGANIVLSYGHPKSKPYVEPISKLVSALEPIYADLSNDNDIDCLFDSAATQLGGIDFLIHSVAFAPLNDLHQPVVDCTRGGFLTAMDISCYSLIACAHKIKPYMSNGGSICTMSYYGAEKYIENYNIMGPVKAALEHSVRYLAHDLGKANIRVNAISAGPISTRAASGLPDFKQLEEKSKEGSPLHCDITIEQVGSLAGFLASDDAVSISGDIIHVDGGYHVVG